MAATPPDDRATIRAGVEHPVFLVGAERSGSTMLRLMLDSHPRITGGEGFEFMVDLVGDDGSFPAMADYTDYLATHNIFGSTGLEIDESLDYPALMRSFLRQRLDASHKEIATGMVHAHYGRLLHIWPEARFIRLLRDPRPVANSVVNMEWYGTTWHGAAKWVHAEEEWDRLQPLLDEDRYIELAFSELVGNHEHELRRVCAFLGVDYTDDMLSYAEETAYGLPDPSRIGDWREEMSERDIQLVEARVGDLLDARGFEPSGLDPIEVGPVERVRLEAENRLTRYRNMVATFGVTPVVMRAVTKVLPIPALERAAAERINTVERANRKRSWRSSGQEFSVRADDGS